MRVCTDSRQAQPGDLFFALAGDRFDGHDYLSEATQNGAVAVVVQRTKVHGQKLSTAVIAVENPRQALGRLAARYRRDFDPPVIAVAGSNGKTTTKELLASVLRQRFKTLWSEASFNNEIGVPLTLLKLDEAGATFHVVTADAGFCGEYRVNLLGRHQVLNCLLAAAVGAELGLMRKEIQRGLAECQPSKMRMQVWTVNGVRVLDDAYNANTDSVLAALEALKEFPCQGRRVAVLGEMAELGPHSAEAHAEVGRRAAETRVDQVFAVGKMEDVMGAAARAAGLMHVTELGEAEIGATAVKHFVRSGDVVLIKASRASRLERVGEVLRGDRKK